jgi:small-conductance mechanosensitive channel
MYISHMRVAFPLLLVNLFSLLLSIGMAYWIAVDIFAVRVAPLLATSAILSVVLGLALQDTLGNLFSGISLQFDKPYEIGHWIECQSGLQKWTGKVLEIHWRATVMTGLSQEIVTVPNRIMAQAQISNFTRPRYPIERSHVFRVAHGTEPAKVRGALLAAAGRISEVLREPEPVIYTVESNELSVAYKLLYSIHDYGAQWSVGDRVMSSALEALEAAGVQLEVAHALRIEQTGTNSEPS